MSSALQLERRLSDDAHLCSFGSDGDDIYGAILHTVLNAKAQVVADAIAHLHVGHVHYTTDVDVDGAAADQYKDERADQCDQGEAVEHSAWTHGACGLVVDRVFAGVADEAHGFVDADHDGIASVHTLGAADALHLQAVADVDAGGAGAHTRAAVDAIAELNFDAFALEFPLFSVASTAFFSPIRVVRHDHRIAVDEHRLKTRVGAGDRSEEHTSELQSRGHLVCRLLLEKKKKARIQI